MKSEIREMATLAFETAVKESLGGKVVPVRTGKKNGWAFDTGIIDPETNRPVFVVMEGTVKSTTDTKNADGSVKTAAFDLEEAVQARIDADNAPKKEKSSKSASDPEAEAKKAKREAQQKMVETWCMENLTDEGQTTTDIKNAIPELEEVTIMQVGSYLKSIAEHNPLIQRDVVKGKPYYSKV